MAGSVGLIEILVFCVGGSSILENLFASAIFFNRIPSYFFASAYQQTK